MKLMMVGINFRTARLEVRERASLSPTAIPGVLQQVRRQLRDSEMVLLSTCNRTELYLGVPPPNKRIDDLIEPVIGSCIGEDALTRHFYHKEGLAAVEHLFAVASSLDSMVVGETDILRQVKQAYLIASEAGLTGKLLNLLFQQAIKTAKRIHTETSISEGRVSVSSIAVEFAEKIFDTLSAKTVMIIGAGKTSETTLRCLADKGVRTFIVVNRSLERAAALAGICGGIAINFNLLDDYLRRADIVVTSTNAPHRVLHAEAVRRAVVARHGRTMLLIDLAVPRDVDQVVGEFDNVYLYNIDDLQATAAANLAQRRHAVGVARSIIRERAIRFDALMQGQDLGSVIREIESSVATVMETELKRAFSKRSLVALPQAGRDEIRKLMQRTTNRILTGPKIALREATRDGHADELLDVVRRMFGLKPEGRDGGG